MQNTSLHIPEKYDYDLLGTTYSVFRRSDPRIASYIRSALGDARTVLNVGAGTGSYEPEDRYVIAVEPSAAMRAQRAGHLAPAIAGHAESLPFDDEVFDASMAVLTLHHWEDPYAGLLEMRRVTAGPVVIVTFDTNELHNFWLTEYAPEFIEIDRRRFPSIEIIANTLGGTVTVTPVAIPFDCIDSIQEAFYGRPEAFLDPEIRNAQSVWAYLAYGEKERIVSTLAAELASGEWDRRYGSLRTLPEFASAMRIVVATR